MTPIAGSYLTYTGRKKMLLVIMIIYGVGVSSAGFSNSIIFMLVSRAIQGIGLSMFPIAFGIIREQFPRQKIAIGQGIISSMFASWFVNWFVCRRSHYTTLRWHATFFTIIPISIILLFTIWRFINIKKNNEFNNSKRIQPGQQQQEKVEKIEGEKGTSNNYLIGENK